MRARKFYLYRIVFCLIILLIASCTRQTNRTVERPAGLGYHAMAYDSESRRVILFGGQTGNILDYPEIFFSAETWAFDPARNHWQKMSPESSPPAMSAQAMAYDSESDRVILHGGGGIFEKGKFEDAILNQTWAYDFNNNTWTRMSDGSSRLGHRMVYDAESDRIVMFGGACFRDGRFQDVEETWVYDFNSDAWTEMKPAVSPAPRHYHGMVYDKRSERVILWGGFLGRSVTDKNIWEYDVNSNRWVERETENSPDPRCYHAMAYDDISGRILVYGGTADGNAETWVYHPDENMWTKLALMTNPGVISRMPMVYSPDTGKLVLFGGQLDSRQFTYSDATWLYDLKTDTWCDVTIRQGEYLGQKKPGMIPEVFAPGVISSEKNEHSSPVFTADMKEVYWSNRYRQGDEWFGEIFFMKSENGVWTKPQVTSFTAMDFVDCNPAFCHDEKRLFFVSCRPLKDVTAYDIWYMQRTGNGWSEAKSIGLPVNTEYAEGGPSLSRNGTLYFFSDREGGKGGGDIYCTKFVNGGYAEPENLGDAINTTHFEYNSFIAPDESYIIFTRYNDESGFGGGDLYISFRKDDGSWTQAKNVGDKINTAHEECFPWVSPDGTYLFFTSNRNGNTDVYWVDAKIIEELKPE